MEELRLFITGQIGWLEDEIKDIKETSSVYCLEKSTELRVFKAVLQKFVETCSVGATENMHERLVTTKIAEIEDKLKGYSQIIDWILKNHYRFGEMEMSLLKKIETIGKKHNF
jgi:hypothetical protein